MPSLGPTEIIIVILIIVILFGWKKLPDAARSLGRSMRIFKAEVEEMKDKPSAASRDTVTGEARRETASETLRPEDHRQNPTPQATPQPAPEPHANAPQSPVSEPSTPRDGEPQYRPPMA